MAQMQDEFGNDLLYGAREISRFLFGSEDQRAKVYRLGETLPLFKLGDVVCARKSRLAAQIRANEQDQPLRRRSPT
jgi:hypothetical protein